MNCENVNEYLGNIIGRGAQGKICNHAYDENKVIKVSNERPVNPLMGPHVIVNEWNLAKRGGELGVSPYVYDFLICVEPSGTGEKYKGYIVMDKVHGKTLTTSDEVLEYFPRILKKIEKLKENNIWYCDLNANNVMIGHVQGSSPRKKKIYLIDYGASKEMPSENIVIDKDELFEELMLLVDGGASYINSKKTLSAPKPVPSPETQRRRALAWRESLAKKKGGYNKRNNISKSIFTRKKTYKNKSTKSTI
jgi:serine/threonine protein kinase